MNRWWDGDFLHNPHLARAFFEGYSGGRPDERLAAQIRASRLLNAVSGVVWATRVGDAPFADANRAALHRLKQENSALG